MLELLRTTEPKQKLIISHIEVGINKQGSVESRSEDNLHV